MTAPTTAARRQAEVALVDRGDAKVRAQEVARYERPYDAHHNIGHKALSATGAHDITGDPAYRGPSDEPYDEVHSCPPPIRVFEFTGDTYLRNFSPAGASLVDQVMPTSDWSLQDHPPNQPRVNYYLG
jgi:hypothetical protein